MAFTTLDPKTALVVIDLQKGIVAFNTDPPTHEIVTRSRILLDEFRRQGLPVVLVNVSGSAPGRVEQKRQASELPADWSELVPELNVQSSDYCVTKRTWGAFSHTDLGAYLKQLGVTHIVLVGIATSMGIESTARSAHELGFNVSFVVDAMTDMNPDTHHNSITRIFPRLGETGTTQAMLELLHHVTLSR